MITPVTTSAEEEDQESPELTAVDAIVGHRTNSMAEDEGKLVDLNADIEVMIESTATNKAAAVMKVNIIW